MFNTSFAQYWKPRTQRNFCLTTDTTGRSIIVASLQATLWSESGTRGDLAAFVSAARRAHCHIANCLSRKSFAHYVLFALSLTKFTVHTMHIAHAILHTLFCTVLHIFLCLYLAWQSLPCTPCIDYAHIILHRFAQFATQQCAEVSGLFQTSMDIVALTCHSFK